ncbi:GTP 3',8-cyclase MoaA [Zhouia amylolytica]|uniref:GTP 3',8-cyclase MoaA n=1 Tax=Zhouia amylolytica TaxID=376730 RepID=UPI0020CC42B8|nr:GTP 3',8-cyclase MoaA [Zhouia amylolytica]MCQ0111288.1 GTP 3',8-cyclase MoaA [Zhouia amylolytica]
MTEVDKILTDTFNRTHTYLRISLTERCNLRCTYCMPAEGVTLSPKSHIMSFEEIYSIAKVFVKHGVTKIRITGGEPLVRKDADIILKKLASLPVELAITTNAVNIERHINILKECGIQKVNVSLDSLNKEKFNSITRRNFFEKVYGNILRLIEEGFEVKMNTVLMKNFNEDEIVDFIKLSKDHPLSVRFIEFMPFDGNKWDISKMVSYQEIMNHVYQVFEKNDVIRLKDAPNDTSKNYKIKDYKGSFAIISSVTNPFCDSCNRLRLTANGKMKNCLFSASETDLLTPLRQGKCIESVIKKHVLAKFKMRGGMDTLEKLKNPDLHTKNRNMTTIGG